MLLVDPRFELPDRFALRRKLDVGIGRVDVFSTRMAHKRLANIRDDSGFHEPRVERMAEIMEAEIADARTADGGLPCGLWRPHRLAAVEEDQALRFGERLKKME